MDFESFLFLALASAAFGYASFRLIILYRLMLATRGHSPRLDHIPARIKDLLIYVLGQKAVLRRPIAGIMHLMIFWGFLILTLETLEQFISTILPWASFEFIGKGPYAALTLLQDLAVPCVLIAVGIAAFRRYILRPEGLGKSRDANVILLLITVLMFATLLMNGFALMATAPWYGRFMPVSNFATHFLAALGFAPTSALALSSAFKWVHILTVLFFAAYIPSSKHLHILAAAPNTFLRRLRPNHSPHAIDFENPGTEQYGCGKISDFGWKDVLDLYSCTECGRCQDVCPAHNTLKPLTPKMLIADLKANLFQNEKSLLSHKDASVSSVIDHNITEDVIWSCTTCHSCETTCPTFINHTDKILGIRQDLVMMKSKFPPELQSVFKNLETYGSPWPIDPSERTKWMDGLSIKTLAEEPRSELLLWAGCAGAFDERYKKVLRSLVSVLKKAGIKFSVLGAEERCTGDAARRLGNEYLFQQLARENIKTLKRYGVTKILAPCPHCWNSFKNDYRELGAQFEVFHHSEFLASLISEGRIKQNREIHERITLHDSCYLGRWNDVYEAPRSIIRAIPSATLTEMKTHREESRCCGAGGGRMWLEEKLGKRINVARAEEAIATRSGIVASSCPFCMTMLDDGIRAKEIKDKIQVLDLAELVDQAMT